MNQPDLAAALRIAEMNFDPEINIVVIDVESEGTVRRFDERGPTRAPDCLRRAWESLQERTGAAPSDVRAMYSEWQPAPEDQAFVEATFPQIDNPAHFPRPGLGWSQRNASAGWDEAMRAVGATLRGLKNDSGHPGLSGGRTPSEHYDERIHRLVVVRSEFAYREAKSRGVSDPVVLAMFADASGEGFKVLSLHEAIASDLRSTLMIRADPRPQVAEILGMIGSNPQLITRVVARPPWDKPFTIVVFASDVSFIDERPDPDRKSRIILP
ncbi:hypothetical protein TA3x_005223 [Tundrisphaera sp. TA3]|uniref:hypothetical protein n=1 Tax=Tundrisphaera sp. TA3 TaxID=3435775 RepID=UPI003EBD2E84